jgi:predicted transcriptional regulator
MAKKLNGGAGHNSGTIWNSRIVNAIERDPEIGNVEKKYNQEKGIARESDLAVLAGVSTSTVHAMLSGKTRRPQHTTFVKIFGAMGFHYKLEREQTPDYATEIDKARGEFKAYKETLAKRKARKRR